MWPALLDWLPRALCSLNLLEGMYATSRIVNQQFLGQACTEACRDKPARRIPHSSPQGSRASKAVIAAHLGLAAAGIWRKHGYDHSQAFSSQITHR